MLDLWIYDLESLDAVSADGDAREVVRRLAGLARAGRLGAFIDAIHADAEIDAKTRAWAVELARNEAFLLAADAYLARFRDSN